METAPESVHASERLVFTTAARTDATYRALSVTGTPSTAVADAIKYNDILSNHFILLSVVNSPQVYNSSHRDSLVTNVQNK